MMNSIEDDIRKIVIDITKTGVRPITRGTLLKKVRADSLDVIQTVTAIEEKFNIELTDKEIMDFKTFGDVVSSVENKLKLEVKI